MNGETVPAVRTSGLTKRYGELEVLRGLDLEVAGGEHVAIIGPSGSGKSTLLRLLMTLETPDSGSIEIEGEAMYEPAPGGRPPRPEEARLRRIRGKLGMVFQHFNLFPHMTALGNVALPPQLVQAKPREEAETRGRELLALVGLAEKADAYPAQLSGGQKQRVAIARALALEPRVMLFDEVTSALDPELVGEVLGVLRTLAHETDCTMLIVTHEMQFAREIADRILFFDRGVILEEGPPAEIFGSPREPRTREFLASVLSG